MNTDLAKLNELVSQLNAQYPLAESGHKKKTVESRKTLFEIKNLVASMKKSIIGISKAARAARTTKTGTPETSGDVK